MALYRRKENGIFNKLLLQMILIIWVIFQVVPILWLVSSSFKPSVGIMNNPFSFPLKSLTIENYDFQKFKTFAGIDISIFFKNSAVVTLISLILLTAVALLAGYALARIRFPGKNIFIFFFIVLMGIPIHALIIPLYYLIGKIGLLNNYFGLAFPYIAFRFSFSTLLAQAYFKQYPNEIVEAAKMDGCGHLRIFFSIIMPGSIGIISTILIVNFIQFWNEFLFALVIMRDNAAKTLTVGLMSFKGERATDWGPMLAVITLAILPTLLFYLIFSRNLIKGLTAGAIKG